MIDSLFVSKFRRVCNLAALFINYNREVSYQLDISIHHFRPMTTMSICVE